MSKMNFSTIPYQGYYVNNTFLAPLLRNIQQQLRASPIEIYETTQTKTQPENSSQKSIL